MFNFLRDKLKQGITAFSKKVDEQAKEEVTELPVEEQPKSEKPHEKKGFFSRLFRRDEKQGPKREPAAESNEKALPAGALSIPEEGEVAASPEPPVERQAEHIAEEEREISEQPEEASFDALLEPGKPLEEPPKEAPLHLPPKVEIEEVAIEPVKQVAQEKPEEKRGFFSRLTEKVVTKKIDDRQFEDLFWDLELGLLENNVAMEVIGRIKADLKEAVVGVPIRRDKVESTIVDGLRQSIKGVLSMPTIDLLAMMAQKKPYVICFVGINGSGKTTTIAKIAKMLLDSDKKVALAAADTFRAAAIDQLQIHADALGVKMIRHDYGSDPAAVAFDAVKYAEAKGLDAVLIDTAGRLHSNTNLIDEMRKIVRVAKPDLKLFIGEAITGNDCVEQAQQFDQAVGIDGIILAKADIDEKGGAALSVGFVTQKPILFLGVGQGYADLKRFDKEAFLTSLGLESLK